MLSGIITYCICITMTTVLPPAPKAEFLPDSMIMYDSNGTVQFNARLYYNAKGWVDSGMGITAESGKREPLAFSYEWKGDTLVQTGANTGIGASDRSKYLFDNSGLLQKQLLFHNDNLIELYQYYYNSAGKTIKEVIDNCSNPTVQRDSIIYNYDNDNHMVSSTEYHGSYGWTYAEFQHDAQGWITRETDFVANSTTRKLSSIVLIYFKHDPTRAHFVNAPRKPDMQIDPNGSILSVNPAEIRQCGIFDARGILHKEMKLNQLLSSGKYGCSAKVLFIKDAANNGIIIGKKTVLPR
jgi:hypothetical protein